MAEIKESVQSGVSREDKKADFTCVQKETWFSLLTRLATKLTFFLPAKFSQKLRKTKNWKTF